MFMLMFCTIGSEVVYEKLLGGRNDLLHALETGIFGKTNIPNVVADPLEVLHSCLTYKKQRLFWFLLNQSTDT